MYDYDHIQKDFNVFLIPYSTAERKNKYPPTLSPLRKRKLFIIISFLHITKSIENNISVQISIFFVDICILRVNCDCWSAKHWVLKLFEKEGFHQAFATYTVSLVLGIFLVLLGTLFLGLVPLNAAHVIHKKMVACLIRAPLSFYATNPVGRIINRFSQDINNLDEFLPLNLTLFSHAVSPTIASLVLASVASIFLLPLILVILLVFFFISRFYLSSALVKRLTSIACGPLYSHFSITMEGVRTIRVHNRQEDFTEEVYKYVFVVSNREVKLYFDSTPIQIPKQIRQNEPC